MNEENDLISIVIPVYNVEAYLNRCLDSILAQTYDHTEIIVVDDGSTDRSGIICDEYAKKNRKIHVIHKQNGGLSDARNKGIEVAQGKYLIFVDSDDFVESGMVEYLYSLVIQNNAQIGICDPVHCYPNQSYSFEKDTCIRGFEATQAIEEMLYQRSFLVSACGKIYLRSLFDNIRFPIGVLFEDSAIMYRLFDNAERVIYSNAKLYAYMHRDDSITTSKFTKRDLDILEICNEIDSYFKERDISLKCAAESYHMAACLRVYLNAPHNSDFEEAVHKSEVYIKKHAKSVLLNNKVRPKMKKGLLLYMFAKPVLPYIYQKINRWRV